MAWDFQSIADANWGAGITAGVCESSARRDSVGVTAGNLRRQTGRQPFRLHEFYRDSPGDES